MGQGALAVPELRKPLADRGVDTGLRVAAAEVLGRIGREAEPAIPELLKALADASDVSDHRAYELAKAVTKTLVKIGPPAIPALREALRTRKLYVRREAVHALLEIGGNAKEVLPS